ncbi:SMI1/KNR4 family protein [Paenibacillus oceani]|uniref:SMI1/KNR4 family protein n=1 Tax=Paenibacillus oceani TaxID=2772510 RepID=A0A927GZ74_9BACL|nr:SMI1/KNR4 family protein [Paenibacillus oceani]MBD2861169.1 SMI1/KNR4 family protein [Paenibacillus oceani]
MKEELMERLRQFLGRADNASLSGTPAGDEQIASAERLLDVRFDADYIEFIKAFGGAYAGLPVHAFANGSAMGNETVVELTLDFRKQYEGTVTEAETLLRSGLVISLDGSGDPILIASTGGVYICYHDSGETSMLAGSFAELIEDNFFEY